MEDTDSTGNLYFTAPLRFTVQAFEHFLHGHKLPEIALPIVHTEQDLFASTSRGCEVVVHLSLLEIGTSSFRIKAEHYTDKRIGVNQIVHVAVNPVTKRLMEIPRELRALLLTIKGEKSVRNFKARK